MSNKDLAAKLAVEGVKTAIMLFVLLLIGRFIETLPFAGLPVFHGLISAADMLSACVSAAAIAVFIKAGLNAKTTVDELAVWLPGAGTLLIYLTRLVSVLFAYSAFQAVALSFIGDLEWAYQSVFLACTLFLLAKSALLIYGASESMSRCLLSVFNQYRETGSENTKDTGR
jgi:mannose/fructose/N-acetylgalactosamine-specific phosphotransferase system component IIC